MEFHKIYDKIKKLFNNKIEETNKNKIKLDILGISYTKISEQNFYVVILGEENGKRKIPVVITYNEAQSIAIESEKILPIVPLIYDTFKQVILENNIKFDEITIEDFKNDILLTYLKGKNSKIEIRTADALSISLRLGYPIFIYDDVLTKVDSVVQKFYEIKDGRDIISNKLDKYNLEELEQLLKESIDEEEYEKASEIRDEIIRKKKNSDNK
jgi:uncharacterized protein